jgi:hypothetical protein
MLRVFDDVKAGHYVKTQLSSEFVPGAGRGHIHYYCYHHIILDTMIGLS